MASSREFISAHTLDPTKDEFTLVINMCEKQIWVVTTNISKIDLYLPPQNAPSQHTRNTEEK